MLTNFCFARLKPFILPNALPILPPPPRPRPSKAARAPSSFTSAFRPLRTVTWAGPSRPTLAGTSGAAAAAAAAAVAYDGASRVGDVERPSTEPFDEPSYVEVVY